MEDNDVVTSFIEAISDGEWHNVAFLEKELSLDKPRVDKIIGFYKHFGFIEADASSDSVRIDPSLSKLYMA